MKKIALMLVTLIMVFAVAGCGDKASDNGSSQDASIESSVDFFGKVWENLGSDKQFPAMGGDAENQAEGPAKFAITDENKEIFVSLLHVTDELYGMLDDDAATLQHAMNTNSFSAAIVKIKDASQAEDFASAYKESVQGQHWMCGFPDKMVVISAGDYIIMAFGLEDNINAFVESCSSVEPACEVLVDAPAVAE